MSLTLEHPYSELSGGTWLNGNLHSHTDRSDGKRPLQEVVADYRDRGHGFLMISDHDTFTSADDLAGLDAGDMLLIPGNEISANGHHMLHVNAASKITPRRPRQLVLNEIMQDIPSFAVVCHPNWLREFDYASITRLEEWVGYAGMEIYNGVIGFHHGSQLALGKWDMLLAMGRRVWGYSNDDSHAAEHCGFGWNQVHVPEVSVSAVVESLRRGRFVASTGVTVRGITVEGTSVRIETENADRIAAIRDTGKRFAQVDDTSIEVEVPEDAAYVRFECWGRGEAQAWTQPFFVTRG